MSDFSFEDCEQWREELGLSMQDFANLLGVSVSILKKIKAGSSSGKQVLQRIELYRRVPEALSYRIRTGVKYLHIDKQRKLMNMLDF